MRATARIRNDGAEAASLIAVEHLILGGRLAAEGTRIALEGGQVIGHEWDGTPTSSGQAWPLLGEEDLSRVAGDDLASSSSSATSPPALPGSPPPTG